MQTKTKIIIAAGVVLVLVGTGLAVASSRRKKQQQSSVPGSQQQNTVISIPGQVYNGLTISQTKALQQKLNSFISSGKLGRVLGWLEGNAPTNYEFKTENGSVYYRYMFEGKQRGWFKYSSASPDVAKQAYNAWMSSGMNNAAKAGAKVLNVITAASSALATFQNTINRNLSNGSLAVDGVYGANTKAVVAALQVYLNATKKLNLTVDGLYGKNTDNATGWRIIA